jgi:hypothetical protein
MEQCICVKVCYRTWKTAMETHELLKVVFIYETLSRPTLFNSEDILKVVKNQRKTTNILATHPHHQLMKKSTQSIRWCVQIDL